MAIMNTSNVIIPEVMEDLIQYEYENALVISKLAYVDNTLVGNPGNVVTIPYTPELPDAETVAQGASLTPNVTQDATIEISIYKAGNSMSITPEAINACLYDVKGNGAQKIAKSIARKVDKDLIAEIGKTSLVHNATALTYATIVDAKAKMGEEGFVNTPVLLVNSADFAELAKTPEFIQGATQIADFGINAAAMLGDMPVIVTDTVAAKTAFLVVPGSFVLAKKQEPLLIGSIDTFSAITSMSAFMHYGVKLPNPDRGVVKISLGN